MGVSVGSTPVAGHNSAVEEAHPGLFNCVRRLYASSRPQPFCDANVPLTLEVSVGSTPVAGHNLLEYVAKGVERVCPSALRQ